MFATVGNYNQSEQDCFCVNAAGFETVTVAPRQGIDNVLAKPPRTVSGSCDTVHTGTATGTSNSD